MVDIEHTSETGATKPILDFHAGARGVNEFVDSALCLTQTVSAAA